MRRWVSRFLALALFIGSGHPSAAGSVAAEVSAMGTPVSAPPTLFPPLPNHWHWNDLSPSISADAPHNCHSECTEGTPSTRPAPCPTSNTSCLPPSNGTSCPRNGGYAFVMNGRCLMIAADVLELNGRIMVPMRSALNAIGGDDIQILWFEDWATPCAQTTSTMICFPIDEHVAIHDGELFTLDQGAVIYPPWEATTRIPIRHLFERVGIKVDYVPSSQTFVLTVPDDPFGSKSIAQQCRLHGYDSVETCPSDRFVVPLAYTAFGWYSQELMPGLISTAHLWGFDSALSSGLLNGINFVGVSAYRDIRIPRLSIESGQIAAAAGYIGLGICTAVVGALYAYEVIIAS